MDRCGFNMFHSTKEGHCADFHVSTWPSRILSAFRHGSNWHGQPKSPTLVPTSGECNIHRCFNPSLSLSIHKLNVLNLSVWEWKASSSISIFQAPGWFYIYPAILAHSMAGPNSFQQGSGGCARTSRRGGDAGPVRPSCRHVLGVEKMGGANCCDPWPVSLRFLAPVGISKLWRCVFWCCGKTGQLHMSFIDRQGQAPPSQASVTARCQCYGR